MWFKNYISFNFIGLSCTISPILCKKIAASLNHSFPSLPCLQSPDMMRYWVHALRYIKAYWSKKEVRETVLSEELERKLLEQVLREEENDEGDEVSSGGTKGPAVSLCVSSNVWQLTIILYKQKRATTSARM